jgi:hypothetical protein
MNNEHFQERISALSQEIIAGAKNPDEAKKNIEELLLCQRQLDIVPVELQIDEASVVKRYPISGAIEIVRCKAAIFLHSTCFWLVSKPTLANNGRGGALYEMLEWYCDYQDYRQEYTEAEREKFDTICAMVVNILTLPMDAFTDMDYCVALAADILEKRTEYYNRLAEEAEKGSEETFEGAVKDAEMAAELEFSEGLREEVRDLAEKDKGE